MSGIDLEGDAGFVKGLLFVGGEQGVVVDDDSAVEDDRSCIAGDGPQRKCRLAPPFQAMARACSRVSPASSAASSRCTTSVAQIMSNGVAIIEGA